MKICHWVRAVRAREGSPALGKRLLDSSVVNQPTAEAPEGLQSGPDAAEETLAPDVCHWQQDLCLHQRDPFAGRERRFKVISQSIIQALELHFFHQWVGWYIYLATHPGLWKLTFWVGIRVPTTRREALNKWLNLSSSPHFSHQWNGVVLRIKLENTGKGLTIMPGLL